MPKATNAEIALRVEEVLRIRLDGAQFHDVVQYAAEKAWGVSERQLWNYVRKADELLVTRRDKRRSRLLALHFARRDSLYARAVNAADYRTALAILSDAAKLQGLYPAVQTKIELPNIAGDLLREAVQRGLDRRAGRDGTGGAPGQPAAAGGGGPAADVADPAPPPPD